MPSYTLNNSGAEKVIPEGDSGTYNVEVGDDDVYLHSNKRNVNQGTYIPAGTSVELTVTSGPVYADSVSGIATVSIEQQDRDGYSVEVKADRDRSYFWAESGSFDPTTTVGDVIVPDGVGVTFHAPASNSGPVSFDGDFELPPGERITLNVGNVGHISTIIGGTAGDEIQYIFEANV